MEQPDIARLQQVEPAVDIGGVERHAALPVLRRAHRVYDLRTRARRPARVEDADEARARTAPSGRAHARGAAHGCSTHAVPSRPRCSKPWRPLEANPPTVGHSSSMALSLRTVRSGPQRGPTSSQPPRAPTAACHRSPRTPLRTARTRHHTLAACRPSTPASGRHASRVSAIGCARERALPRRVPRLDLLRELTVLHGSSAQAIPRLVDACVVAVRCEVGFGLRERMRRIAPDLVEPREIGTRRRVLLDQAQ